MHLHRLLRLAPIAAALLLILAFVTSCGGDPYDPPFHNDRTAPPPIVTGTIIGVSPTPSAIVTATP